jgi:hypothetical protein
MAAEQVPSCIGCNNATQSLVSADNLVENHCVACLLRMTDIAYRRDMENSYILNKRAELLTKIKMFNSNLAVTFFLLTVFY